MNSVAREVIEAVRGDHPEFVFTYKGNPIQRLNNTAWQNAVEKAGLRDVRGPGKHFRVHDMRHTFSTRLREAGVPLEDRKDLLGHKNQDITTHYSTAETGKLLEYVERLVTMESDKPSIYVVREAV